MFVSLVCEGNYSQFMEVKDSVTNEKSFKVILCLYTCANIATDTQVHVKLDMHRYIHIYSTAHIQVYKKCK